MKGRKTVSVCRRHDFLCRNPKKSTRTNKQNRTPRTNKWLGQGCRIQYWHTNIKGISIYAQWTLGNQNKKYNTIYNLLKKMKFLGIHLTKCIGSICWKLQDADERNLIRPK